MTAALCNFSNAVRGITAQALSNIWKQALCICVWLHALHVLARLQFNMRLFVRQFKACKLLAIAFILSLACAVIMAPKKSKDKELVNKHIHTTESLTEYEYDMYGKFGNTTKRECQAIDHNPLLRAIRFSI